MLVVPRAGLLILIALLAVTGAVGFVYSSYKSEIDRARDAVTRGGRIAITTVGPIEYAESGEGLPLLAIHGAGGGYDQGLAIATDLVGGRFRVIAPSRFGYLGTPIPQDVSSAAQADAHAALLSALNISNAIVVGVSAGARSAAELALRHPDKVSALILIVPGTYAPDSPVAVEGSRSSKLILWMVNYGADFGWWAAEKITPSLLIRFIGVQPELVAAMPAATRDRVMSIVKIIQPLSRRFAGINVDSIVDMRELPRSKIVAPTLVISARDDLFNTLPAAEFAASRIPGAELIVYETGGHLLVGHEQEVREAVQAFLARAGLAPPR